MDGPATAVTAAYENSIRERSRSGDQEASSLQTEASPLPMRVRSVTVNGHREAFSLHTGEDLEILVEYEVTEPVAFAIGVGIERNDGLVCHAVNLSRISQKIYQGPCTVGVRVVYPKVPLLHGEFYAMGYLLDASGVQIYHQKVSAPFRVEADGRQRIEVGLVEMEYHWEPVEPKDLGA